ncbi:regulator of sigma E protease [Rhodobium orientis]|uniref:Zinc metalloprotease n=1 Tax=Rhodobium orientis TaxID=34017 RepID=A0A327JT57_9HYPH|nr:RIP metalloprotease RseP [Rhodobium orientis]MBB4302446.1 regulator of sigma E protease [Rhodobium orientis]MBK5949295.1 RIP metalloprotease RseP [Rhodobium orientis]RAI28654.1 RIP metalloprotease RseP [Rhodobium orientis]
MEIITGTGSVLVGTILPFLIVLTVVVFFHELGHFLVARWCGIRVLVFSIGFGPELFGRVDRHGTRWKVSAIPLGGFVKFYGDEGAASTPDRDAVAAMNASERSVSFPAKPLWQRAAVVAAGPLANFVLAIAIFTLFFSIYGKQMVSARVDTVQPQSAAAAAGFEPGDRIVEIDGQSIESFADVQRMVSVNAGLPLDVVVERDGTRRDLVVTPELRTIEDRFGNEQRLGILGIGRSTKPSDVIVKTYLPHTAFAAAVEETWDVLERTVDYVGGVIAGRNPADQLGGPIRVAHISGQVASLGVMQLINLIAVLSISIGLINLVPIPLLDGGHLAFYAIEAVRGRPLSERVMDLSYRVGFALVLSLMIFVTWNDITTLSFFGAAKP